MRILVTNDDGIGAEGMDVLRRIAAGDFLRRVGRRAGEEPVAAPRTR